MADRAGEAAALDAGFSEMVAEVKARIVAAEDVALTRQSELDAARLRAEVARDAASAAKAEVKRLYRILRALEAPSGRTGRPRGGDVDGVNERIRALLPSQSGWRGVDIRDELANQGIRVSANRVSAALASLRKQGAAVHVGRGYWKAGE